MSNKNAPETIIAHRPTNSSPNRKNLGCWTQFTRYNNDQKPPAVSYHSKLNEKQIIVEDKTDKDTLEVAIHSTDPNTHIVDHIYHVQPENGKIVKYQNSQAEHVFSELDIAIMLAHLATTLEENSEL